MRLLFIYKKNPQDPSERALRRWLPRMVRNFREFTFKPSERKRFDPENMYFSRHLKALIERYRPTHIFCWVVYLNPEEIEWCRNRGIRVTAALNGFSTFSTGLYADQSLYFDTLRKLDGFLVPHRPHIPALISHGIKAREMRFFYDPGVFYPLKGFSKLFFPPKADVFFVGNVDNKNPLSEQGAYRRRAIKALAKISKVNVMSDFSDLNANVKRLRITSSDCIINWHANRSLTSVCFDYFPDINKYESLNTNIVQSYDSDYLYAVRPRILTMMGAGTPVFIDRHPLIEEMFTDGVEVVMWKGIEDLCERFLQYQKTPKVLRNIAAQGHKKVLSAYSVEQRLAQTILPVIVG